MPNSGATGVPARPPLKRVQRAALHETRTPREALQRDIPVLLRRILVPLIL
jgi:hypothetical protein